MYAFLTGTIAAIATFIVLTIRHSVEEFVFKGNEWEARQIGFYVNFFIMGVTVLVVAVPEGLPLAVTLALAYSVRVGVISRPEQSYLPKLWP